MIHTAHTPTNVALMQGWTFPASLATARAIASRNTATMAASDEESFTESDEAYSSNTP